MKGLGNAEIFGRNLRMYLEQSGKLAKDVAAYVGVAPATFSEWVNGKKYPRIDKIEMLANYFHIQKSDLIEEHAERQQGVPVYLKHGEVRVLAKGFDRMPEEKRKKAIDLAKMIFSEYANYFEEGEDDDES